MGEGIKDPSQCGVEGMIAEFTLKEGNTNGGIKVRYQATWDGNEVGWILWSENKIWGL